MPIRVDEHTWKCSVCGLMYPRDTEALSCEQSHDIVYVQFKKEDLFRLLEFIMTKDERLLTHSLMKSLRKYMKGNY